MLGFKIDSLVVSHKCYFNSDLKYSTVVRLATLVEIGCMICLTLLQKFNFVHSWQVAQDLGMVLKCCCVIPI